MSIFNTIKTLFTKQKKNPMASMLDIGASIVKNNENMREYIRKEMLAINERQDELSNISEEIKQSAIDIRKSLEDELEQTKRRSALIADSLPDAIISTDYSGRILSANAAANEIFGYESTELVTTSIDELIENASLSFRLSREAERFHMFIKSKRIVNSDFEKFRSYYNEYVRSNKLLDSVLELKGSTKTHKIIDLEYRANILNPEANELENTVFIIIIKDVSEYRQAVEQLEKTKQVQLGILASVPNPVFYADENQQISNFNKAFYSLIQKDILGETLDNLLGTPDTFLQINNLLRKAEPNHIEIQQIKVCINNVHKILVIYCTAIIDFQGKFRGVVGAIVDLTQLLSVERLKDTLLDSIPNPVYYLDQKARYIGCNEPYAKMLGLSIEDIVGKTRKEMFDLVCLKHPSFKQYISNWHEKDVEFFSNNLVEQTYEARLYDVSKRDFRDIIVFRTIIDLQDGTFNGVLSVMTDITELKGVQKLKQNLFELLPSPVFFKDAALKFTEINQAYVNMVGLPRNVIIGKTREELIQYASNSELKPLFDTHKDMIESLDSIMTDKDVELSIKPEELQIFETQMWSQELQEFRTVIFYRKGIYDSNNLLDGVLGTILDVTELKAAEYDANTRRAQLEILLDAVPDIVIFEDMEGNVVLQNQTAKTFFEYSDIKDVFIEATNKMKTALSSVHQTRQTLEIHEPLTGIPSVFDIFQGIVNDISGTKIVTIARNVSHLIDQLHQSTTLAAALNSVTDIVCIVDSRRKFVFVNMSFYYQYGIEPSDLIDTPIDKILKHLPDLSIEKWKGEIEIHGIKAKNKVYVELTPCHTQDREYFTVIIDIRQILGEIA